MEQSKIIYIYKQDASFQVQSSMLLNFYRLNFAVFCAQGLLDALFLADTTVVKTLLLSTIICYIVNCDCHFYTALSSTI